MQQRSILMIYLFALIGGILLTILHSRANLFEGIVVVIGVLFIVPCLYMLFGLIVDYLRYKRMKKAGEEIPVSHDFKSLRWLMLVPIVGGLLFGLFLVMQPVFFVKYLIYTFGAVMFLCGLTQSLFLISAIRYYHVSAWWIVVPLIVMLAGVAVFIVGAEKIESAITLLTGIMLILYSVNGFISFVQRESRLRQIQLLQQI